MRIDPLAIALVGLFVSVVAVLFGPGIALRVAKAARGARHARRERDAEVRSYLRDAAIFLDGLPWFIRRTWAWGPSVPNYAAGGRFPDQDCRAMEDAESLKAAVRESLEFYVEHSRSQGQTYPTLEETLVKLDEITQRFWQHTETLARRRWPSPPWRSP